MKIILIKLKVGFDFTLTKEQYLKLKKEYYTSHYTESANNLMLNSLFRKILKTEEYPRCYLEDTLLTADKLRVWVQVSLDESNNIEQEKLNLIEYVENSIRNYLA